MSKPMFLGGEKLFSAGFRLIRPRFQAFSFIFVFESFPNTYHSLLEKNEVKTCSNGSENGGKRFLVPKNIDFDISHAAIR